MSQVDEAATHRASGGFSGAAPTTSSNRMLWTGRVISGIIVVFLLVSALAMVARTNTAVEGAADLGYTEGAVVGVGTALLISTLLYMIRRTAVLGALLLTAYFGGAVATHVVLEEPEFVISPVIVCALLWAGLVLRDPRLRQFLTGYAG